MNILFYLIFSLFFLKGLTQIFNQESFILGFFFILLSFCGIITLIKKYNQKYLSALLIPLLLAFMMSH